MCGLTRMHESSVGDAAKVDRNSFRLFATKKHRPRKRDKSRSTLSVPFAHEPKAFQCQQGIDGGDFGHAFGDEPGAAAGGDDGKLAGFEFAFDLGNNFADQAAVAVNCADLHGLFGVLANHGSGVKDAWTVWPSGVIHYMTANQVNVFDDAANNFFLSGVQLEVGAIATDFEHEPFSVTLAKCQRYFFRLNDLDSSMAFMSGQAISATRTRAVIHLPVTMRNTAYGGITLALSDATHFSARAVNVAKAASGIAAQGSAGGSAVYLDLTIASTTAGDSILHESDTANAYVDFSSEI